MGYSPDTKKASKGKLAPKWLGPYSFINIQLDSLNVTMLKKNKLIKVDRNLLKQLHERILISMLQTQLDLNRSSIEFI